ncbi:MAG TPA: hypothetical protein VEA19_03160 [Actinomycetota bacterium]|nr:hypothetical protein [Actinomycetota bacterium]
MNEQSLNESNAILKAASSHTQVGAVTTVPPSQLADEAGIENRLSAARAFRALMARGRIAREGDDYRLLDAKPLEPGERASVRRPIKRRKRKREEESEDGLPTYEQVGRVVIERLIESSAEAAELRVALERARTEAEAARKESLEANRAAATDRRKVQGLEDELHSMRKRLEMTESNLRTLVETAKRRPASPLEDTDAKAILDILSKTEAAGTQ